MQPQRILFTETELVNTLHLYDSAQFEAICGERRSLEYFFERPL